MLQNLWGWISNPLNYPRDMFESTIETQKLCMISGERRSLFLSF
jgi:hypothetical protein